MSDFIQGYSLELSHESVQILLAAHIETYEFNHDYVGTEQILLALIKHRDLRETWEKYEVTYEGVKRHVVSLIRVGSGWGSLRPILDLHAKRALAFCEQVIIKDRSRKVTPEDMLFALVSIKEGVAYEVLQKNYPLVVEKIQEGAFDGKVLTPSPGEIKAFEVSSEIKYEGCYEITTIGVTDEYHKSICNFADWECGKILVEEGNFHRSQDAMICSIGGRTFLYPLEYIRYIIDESGCLLWVNDSYR